MIDVSIIVPSRLAASPVGGTLWLDRALESVAAQQGCDKSRLEIVVGIDPGMRQKVPERLLTRPAGSPALRFVESSERGQAQAVNAAASAATADVLAFLEDDDLWQPQRLASGMKLLAKFELVTCNSQELDSAGERFGTFIRIFDFPTPSGWLMRRALWDEVGAFDTSFRWHMDTEWIGRANRARKRRVHQVDQAGGTRVKDKESWLAQVARWSAIAVTPHTQPLVDRYVHQDSGVGQIESDPKALARSVAERERIVTAFGTVPW